MPWFSRKSKAQPVQPRLVKIDDQVPLIPFEAYGVSILHPQDWRIFVNPSKPFLYHDGYAKIDRSVVGGDKSQDVSLSLRWAQLNKQVTIDDYVDEIKRQYELKQKKNKSDRYQIDDIRLLEHLPHRAYSIQSSITANHSIYRVLKDDERFKSIEYVTYCEVTDRIVMATICAYGDIFAANRDLFLCMLNSLGCHSAAQELPKNSKAA